MSEAHCHLRVIGARRADRLRCAAAAGGPTVVALCDRRLRGPYTGVDTVLTALLPEAHARWPELVEEHRAELLYGVPELAEVIGTVPQQLTSTGPFAHRTRRSGGRMIRCMSQGVVTFLLGYARRVAAEGGGPLRLVFEDIHAAEVTTQEFVALLLRRCDPEILQVVVCGRDELPDGELAGTLPRRARTLRVADTANAPAGTVPHDERGPEALVRAYVEADGSSDDPAEAAAYAAAYAADPERIRALHDRRADRLERNATWGTRVGALPYHRERGTDPGRRGRAALTEALRLCAEQDFSAAVVDLGLRGRAVTDPAADQQAFCEFTTQAAGALVPLGRLEESLALYFDLRKRYTDPVVHMTTSFAIAMLYTRFFSPRDHEAAIAWQNNAVALSALLRDPRERALHQVFNDNALAVIEMHRGNFHHGLSLIEAGIARLDGQPATEEWVVHRSRLLYNRARLLAALGRVDEAYTDLSTLVELDPYSTEYLGERARISRGRGDPAAALADYDTAIALSPPFPELYRDRGAARREAGDAEGALADFDLVLELEPDDLPARAHRAELLLDAGDLAGAERDVLAGLELRPDDARLLCLYGMVLLERGQVRQAERRLDAALAADPDYPPALVNRAAAHFRLGRPAAAAEVLTRALHSVGADPHVLLHRGMAHAAAQRAALALDDFDTALTLPGADLAEIHYQRGLCLLGLDQYDMGVADLQVCRRLGAHLDDIEELLASA
ncbi:tetratricopeptide repeat protein [Streptomyces sp. NPDC006733]|uniref:tetratricopeptide repeat protein n=1 Tax=Streptomyces sp. NPDC006733 TaxID=3155460 RepID=UPI0034072FD8